MTLIELVLFGTPDPKLRIIAGDTEDGKYSYAMIFDRETFSPASPMLRKLRHVRRFVFFGPKVWRRCPDVKLTSPEGSEVRRFFSNVVPELSRECDREMAENLSGIIESLTRTFGARAIKQ